MDKIVNIFTCIFVTIIFDDFFRGLMPQKNKNKLIKMGIYIATVLIIASVNLFYNPKLNLIVSVAIYFIDAILLFEGGLKEKIFCYMTFYTVIASVEIIFEFLLSFFIGNKYSWKDQAQILKFLVSCLEKLSTFIILFLIKRKLSKRDYGLDNKLIISSLILPFTTLWIYSTLVYSNLMFEITDINESALIIGCILLLFSNAIIFLMHDYVFRLVNEKQTWEIMSLKTDMEKRYYDRMEKVNIEQAQYMHDLRFLLKTIGDLAIQDQNQEIKNVIQNMEIRLGDIEEDCFCKNKVLNTILCEKKREAKANHILYNAYVEPGINLRIIKDIDIIIIMGNIIDNAIDAAKKVKDGFIDINIFENQKGHFLIIKVENKFNGDINRNGADFYTTKVDREGKHGFGIKNVKACIEKYGALMQIDNDTSMFTVTLIFTIL